MLIRTNISITSGVNNGVMFEHRKKSICYFDNCYQNCNCGLEIVPCGNQLWQYNTHGVQEEGEVAIRAEKFA